MCSIKAITRIKELTTQIYFRDHIPPAYEDYVKGRDTQYPKRILYYPWGRLIEFDIVMDYWNIIRYKQSDNSTRTAKQCETNHLRIFYYEIVFDSIMWRTA